MTTHQTTEQQRQALVALQKALLTATHEGMLDMLQPECANPDSINDVCNAVDWLANALGLDPLCFDCGESTNACVCAKS